MTTGWVTMMSEPERRRYTVSLSAEEADVLDAVAHLNGYTGRPGAWIGDQVRLLVLAKRGDADVKRLIRAREQYQQSRGRRTKHGLGVIDGGASMNPREVTA
jgi:hypothetical protein